MNERVHRELDLAHLIIGFHCLMFGFMVGFCTGKDTALSKSCEHIENRAEYAACMEGKR